MFAEVNTILTLVMTNVPNNQHIKKMLICNKYYHVWWRIFTESDQNINTFCNKFNIMFNKIATRFTNMFNNFVNDKWWEKTTHFLTNFCTF